MIKNDDVSSYCWVIYEHCLHDDPKVPIIGPSNVTAKDVELALSLGLEFKLYDDDGILYYKGRMYSKDCNLQIPDFDETSFAPLDDYGMPNSGCTRIDYLNDGSWFTL